MTDHNREEREALIEKIPYEHSPVTSECIWEPIENT